MCSFNMRMVIGIYCNLVGVFYHLVIWSKCVNRMFLIVGKNKNILFINENLKSYILWRPHYLEISWLSLILTASEYWMEYMVSGLWDIEMFLIYYELFIVHHRNYWGCVFLDRPNTLFGLLLSYYTAILPPVLLIGSRSQQE
jgi:hypothetical protein